MAAHWISVQAAAEQLKVSYHTCRNWCLAGKLRSKTLPPSDHRVVDAVDVRRLLRDRERIDDGGTSRVH
jgi:predicted site-specific integrase-resolvase